MNINVKVVVGDSRVALAKRMWEVIDVNQYLNEVFGSAYKVITANDDDEELLLCSFEPLTKSLKRYEFDLIGSANLAAQLITLYRNHDDIASAEGLVKSLNLLDELSVVNSSVGFIEFNFSVLMAVHKLTKIRQEICVLKQEN